LLLSYKREAVYLGGGVRRESKVRMGREEESSRSPPTMLAPSHLALFVWQKWYVPNQIWAMVIGVRR